MEYIIYLLMLFIFLNCAFKLSLWKIGQRLLFSILLGAFTYWSVNYAMLQSKTQIADYLQNSVILQNMAIIVTIESAVCLAFCILYLNGSIHSQQNVPVYKSPYRLLFWYPSLLVFPVVFFLLTQALFTLTGVDFTTTALWLAMAIIILLPLFPEIIKRLLPEEADRIEMHLLLTIFICVLGLISTENGIMVYEATLTPIDWNSLLLTFLFFLLLFISGIFLAKLRWRLRR